MKYLLFFILFSTASHAQPLCDENGNPISAIAELATPNCLNGKYLDPAIENNTAELCNSCKHNFQKFVKEPIVGLTKQEKQNQFLDAAFKEYQKNLTENLLETLKLRAMRPTGAKFASSIKSCQMKSLSDFSKGCNSPKAIEYLKNSEIFKKFNDNIPVELGKILSSDENYYPEKSLLDRKKPTCFIPEKDLLYISISALEESLSPEIIKALSAIDGTKFESVEEIFLDENVASKFKDQSEIDVIISSLKTHPLIADKMSSPGSIVNFFKSIKEPKDVRKLRDSIYSTANGDDFDKKLAAKCDEGFNSLKDAICSNDFEQGKINLNAFQNHSKLFNKPLRSSTEEFTTTPELEKKNIDLLKLCDANPESAKIQLTHLYGKLNKSLNPNYIDKTLEAYKLDKHDKDLGQINENLCQRQNQNCNDETYACKILQKYKSTKDPKSLDYKLANSSNKEVNELLRSMIGDTSRIDVKTKEILIAQGIIPKDDGSMVKQPDIPERQPEYYAKEQPQQPKPNQQQANANIGKFNPVTGKSNASNTNGRIPASDTTIDEGYSNVGTKTLAQGPDFSDLMEDQQELRSIQDEIKRRLLGTPDKPTEAEARKVVRDSFKSRKQRLSPEMEDAFTNRIMESNSPSTPQAFANNTQDAPSTSDNRAQVSGGDSAQAKWRKQQDQNALMGMAGAQQALGKESSNTTTNAEAKPKDLTKVALNLADDPRVNLSELFNKKIDQNDSETQLLKVLLRNKNNFLLQIKSMNFKVIFDEKQNFNVLLESGDQQEAARIRPQLEMFLKKLKT